ncbi:cadherin EGF LAG seven-pass G-type receptor 2-like [Amphiura filiformis]|uniref:cadherin EGF LAG seven-pass G-type receptor 2-like n=1 Tax=Amphiura filiformis TaxID=82378 RepID=UPI003B217943
MTIVKQASVTDVSITCQPAPPGYYDSTIEIRPVDLSPRFDQPAYLASILEETKYGTIVTSVSARTYDHKEEGIMYLLTQATNGGEFVFELNDDNGDIMVVSEETDALKTPEYVLFIEAEDRRSQPTRSVSTVVTIFVNDTNNQCPEFSKEAYFGEISASDLYAVESGTLTQLLIIATDNDTIIEYTDISISSGDVDNIFALDPSDTVNRQSNQWSIKLVEPLLIQDGLTYNLTVTLTDTATGRCTPQVIDVTIIAADLSPRFDFNEYKAAIDERAPIGTLVVKVEAHSGYDNTTTNIYYSLKSGNNQGLAVFTIDRKTGWITVIDDKTDAETVKEFTLVVVAEDRATQPTRTSSATVIITLNDINDNCPRFDDMYYTGTVTPQDKYVVRNDGSLSKLALTTVDEDTTYSGKIEQVPGPNDGIFGIEENVVSDRSTEVYVTLEDPTKLGLDFYTLLISITDDNTVPSVPPCDNIIANVSIIITADLSPVFDVPPGGYIGYLIENSPIGTFIITIIAKSYDGSTGNIKYQLKDGKGLFEIGRDSGDITTISADVDFELIQEYTLVVEAQDRSTEPFRSATTTVIIRITNTNDNCPEFERTSYSGQISLQDLYVTEDNTLDRLILIANDADPTFDGEIDVLFGPGLGVFDVEEDRSIIGRSRVSIRLVDDDRLTDSSYDLQILAYDTSAVPSVDCSGTPINVHIEVVSDFAPIFTSPEYTTTIIEGAAIGTWVVQVEATSQGTQPDIVYIIKSVSNIGASFFTIDRDTGIIRVASDQTDFEAIPEYIIVVEAQDRGTEPFRSATTTVTVTLLNMNDNCPRFDELRYTGTVTPLRQVCSQE